MKTAVILLSLFQLCLSLNCPLPPDIPVMDERTGLYTAALLYQGPGHEYDFQACNGPKLTYVDEDRVSVDNYEAFYEVGSLIVKAGCNFVGFADPGFTGASNNMRGPAVYSQSPGFEYPYGRGFKSWFTTCDMSYINCSPEDRYEVIFTCNNVDGFVDLECKYSKTIGTSFSQEISDSMNIDTTIEESMSASFFGMFGASIGVSVTTGYNWGSVSSEAQHTEETFEVTATAPAGTSVFFEQATGFCGGSTVKTEMFRISHQKKNGEIIKTEIINGI